MGMIEILKEKSKVAEYLNNRLYFQKYYITRTKITKCLYLASFASAIKYEFNICEVHEEENPKDTLDSFLEFHAPGTGTLVTIENQDLTKELKTYLLDVSKQKVYFFNKAFCDDKELPLFYGLLYLNDASSIDEDNRDENNYEDFLAQRDSAFVNLVYTQKLKPSYPQTFLKI